jgi:hypothetical protein
MNNVDIQLDDQYDFQNDIMKENEDIIVLADDDSEQGKK